MGSITFLSVWFLSAPLLGDITVGGNRPVQVHVPASYDPGVPAPLLILLHGYNNFDPNYIEPYLRFQPLSDRYGFLFAHPDGTTDASGFYFWNATDACCNFNQSTVDDSGYLKRVIDEVRERLNVDPDRIFLAGHSNGGFMSYRAACDHSGTVAAIASLAGATFSDPARCGALSPVHVLQVHGTADEVVAYSGGSFVGSAYPGALASAAQWAERNGCLVQSTRAAETLDLDVSVAGAETLIDRYERNCPAAGAAEVWSIVGGAHSPSFHSLGGSTSFAVNVWDWLMRHPKRPSPESVIALTPEAGTAPLEVVADGSGSTAPEGTVLARHRWDFGDGARVEGEVASHTYARAGRYLPTLTVFTEDGRVSRKALGTVTARCPSGDVAPWVPADVGTPAFPGSARPEGNDLIVCAGGRTLSGRSDQLFFLHREVAGDHRFTARIADVEGALVGSRAGVLFRRSLEADSEFAGIFLDLIGNVTFASRSEAGAAVRFRGGGALPAPGGWLRIQRRGRTYMGMKSADGVDWIDVHQVDIDGIEETALAGIASSGNDVSQDVSMEPFRVRLSDLDLSPYAGAVPFRRGDANADGGVDISDGVAILGFLFIGDPEPPCLDAADANDSGGGSLDISDAVSIFEFLFLGTQPALPLPGHLACGTDSTVDELGCAGFPPCPP